VDILKRKTHYLKKIWYSALLTNGEKVAYNLFYWQVLYAIFPNGAEEKNEVVFGK
jgi:hypothetical protein